jgi:hypothetical protein
MRENNMSCSAESPYETLAEVIIKEKSYSAGKILFLFFILLFLSVPGFSEITPYWDIGKFSFSGIKRKDNWYADTELHIGTFYFIEDRTGLYLSFCPCRAELVYNADLGNNTETLFPWNTLSVSFVNLEVGWNTVFGRDFMFSPFIRMNTVDTVDIANFVLSSGVEISWIHAIEPFCSFDYSLLPKVISLETGITAGSVRLFYPCFYCSIGLNLGICFGALSSTFN